MMTGWQRQEWPCDMCGLQVPAGLRSRSFHSPAAQPGGQFPPLGLMELPGTQWDLSVCCFSHSLSQPCSRETWHVPPPCEALVFPSVKWAAELEELQRPLGLASCG